MIRVFFFFSEQRVIQLSKFKQVSIGLYYNDLNWEPENIHKTTSVAASCNGIIKLSMRYSNAKTHLSIFVDRHMMEQPPHATMVPIAPVWSCKQPGQLC